MQTLNFLSSVRVPLLVAAALAGAVVDAAPVFYTSEAAFHAAVAGIPVSLTTDSYEDLPQGWVFGPLDRGDYKVTNGGNQVFVVDNAADAYDGTKALVMGVPNKPGTFTFDAPIVAFSIGASDILSIQGGDVTVEIDGGPAQTMLSGLFGSRNKQFLGIIDVENPFKTFTFSNTDIADTWTFDRAQYGRAAAATPEPGAWILMASGLAAVGLGKLRR